MLERHRAIVRETDKQFSMTYGAGGATVLFAGLSVLTVAWWLNALSSLIPWVLSVTVVLVSLFVLNAVVRKRRTALRARIIQYCEVNEIDSDALRAYYEKDGIYPYFLAVLSSDEARA